MTDPQNDIPCRDCGQPTQHATERCDDCRTPAGRLVTALAALGIKATPIDSFDVVVDKITVSADHLSWCLLCDDDTNDHAHNVEAAANAIAAIVDYPALLVDRNRLIGEEIAAAGRLREVTAERDTLAAENARLRAELEKPVAGAWRSVDDSWRGLVRTSDSVVVATMAVNPKPGHVGWGAVREDGTAVSGPETGDAGRHAADLALIAAGYRLIGGVHPAQGEVKA